MGVSSTVHSLRSRLLHGLLAACLVSAPLAHAADLGPIMVTSPVGQPLDGSLSLSLGPGETADQLQVGVGQPAEYQWLEIERPSWIDELTVGLSSEAGETLIRLTSKVPPPERTFSLLLVAASPLGRSLRQYDIVLYEPEVLQPPRPVATPPEPAPPEQTAAVAGEEAVPTPAAEPPPRRPVRRAQRPADRVMPEVRRDLSISSAGARVPDANPDRRAQRLEDGVAAQQRALSEANARISDLQGQVAKLEKLLALKAAAPAAAEVAKPSGERPAAVTDAAKAPARPAGETLKESAKPAMADASKEPPAATAKEAVKDAVRQPTQTTPADPASPPPPAAEAAKDPAEPTAVDAGQDASAGSEVAKPEAQAGLAEGSGSAKPVGAVEESLFDAEWLQGLPALFGDDWVLVAGGSALAALVALLGFVFWRRRRERREVMAATLASAAAVAAPTASASAGVSQSSQQPLAEDIAEEAVPPATGAASPSEVAAEEAVEESFAERLDAPLGAAGMDEVETAGQTPVASLTAVTATVDPAQEAAALDDDLETMFSAESIAAAQAAIASTAAVPPVVDDGEAGLQALSVPEPEVEEPMPAAAGEDIPDLEALLAAEPAAAKPEPAPAEEAIPDLEALLAAEPPSLAGEAVPDLEALLAAEPTAAEAGVLAADGAADLEALLAGEPATGAQQPAPVSSPADSGEPPEAIPVDSEADFEDVEVNLAKAYIDMGDPEGANAILEGMMADTENPDRVERAQRMVHHFGLQPRLTTGDSDS